MAGSSCLGRFRYLVSGMMAGTGEFQGIYLLASGLGFGRWIWDMGMGIISMGYGLDGYGVTTFSRKGFAGLGRAFCVFADILGLGQLAYQEVGSKNGWIDGQRREFEDVCGQEMGVE
ncbi:hypothetical protein VTJ04DRAFT_9194 [Mycothermus thermophilus]|uniref:uncharacterized protein n=1 Tax=Humicola insolens TaxID=85995 RepID=UPI0037431942